MSFRPGSALAGICFSCLALHADVTETFVVRILPSKSLPPEVAAEFAKKMAATTDALSFETKIKGSRALVRAGSSLSVSDFDGALLTVVDRPSRRFSTVSPQEYQRAWHSTMSRTGSAGNSDAPKLQMRITSKVHSTGQTRKIQGIETEEHQLSISTGTTEQDGVHLVVSLWCPVQTERARHPALLELQRYTDRAYVPADFLAEMTKSLNATASGLTDMYEGMKSIGPFLEMRSSYIVPGLGNEPMFEMVQELVEFSTDEIPASVFEVPRDYAPTSIEELLPVVLSPTSVKPGDVKAPVMRPGTEDPVSDPDKPKLQRREP